MDVSRGFKCSRGDFISAKLEQILASDNVSYVNQFPSGWLGEIPSLINPTCIEFNVDTEGLSTHELNVDAMNPLQELEAFHKLLLKTLQKRNGDACERCHHIETLMGISNSFVKEMLGRSEHFSVALVEAFEIYDVLGYYCFNQMRQNPVLILGDSSNSLIAALESLAARLKKKISWHAVLRSTAYEGVMRNIVKVNDIFDYLNLRSVITCALINETLEQEAQQIMDKLNRNVDRCSCVIVDGSGEHLMEDWDNLASTGYDGTKWLYLARILLRAKLQKGGCAVIRLHVLPLTNPNFVRLLLDIIDNFTYQRWIMPVCGRDNGILYLVLYNYQTTSYSKGTLDSWPLPVENYPFDNQVIKLGVICNVLIKVIPPYIAFTESAILIMNCNETEMNRMRIELIRQRQGVFNYLNGITDRVIDLQYLNNLLDLVASTSLIFGWHTKTNTRIDSSLSMQIVYLKKTEENRSLMSNLYQAKQFRMNEAITFLQHQRLICTRAWEFKVPRSLSFPRTTLNFTLWSGFNFDSSPLDVILSSRWCVSGIVHIRGILKQIVMPHAERILQRDDYEDCRLCRSDNFFKFCQLMREKESFRVINPANATSACFGETFRVFASATDKDLAYCRAQALLDHIKNLVPGKNFYACSFPLLTRLDLGLIYLVASMFFETKIIACNRPQVANGILFRNMIDGRNFRRIREHVTTCIRLKKNEFVDAESLNNYFSTYYVYAANMYQTNGFIKRTLRNALMIATPNAE